MQALDGEPDMEVDIGSAKATVKGLVQMLETQKYGGRPFLIDQYTGEAALENYLVAINGGPWELLNGYLETELKSGDRVWFARLMEMIGGG